MMHGLFLLTAGLLFGAMPTSSNYGLHNYGFGSGGTSNSSSSSYRLNGTTGQTNGTQSASSSNYSAKPGNNNSQQANVPFAPTVSNPSNYYDKLKYVVNPGTSSPTDTKYSIAISSDNFVTTRYVQADNTIGSSKVYQTYATWGGAGGQNVIGLSQSTTYALKVNAIQGDFTETQYGASASAATVAPTISFSISTTATSTPPFSTVFSQLLPATVVTAGDNILVSLATNANAGATVYVSSLNAGLKSAHANNFVIASATADLSGASTGYGAQSVSATQTTGGPFSSVTPYNGITQNVGALSTLLKPIYSSSAPLTGGSSAFKLMARASQAVPAATDYTDTLNLTAAGSF